jgi:hypothetical protein
LLVLVSVFPVAAVLAVSTTGIGTSRNCPDGGDAGQPDHGPPVEQSLP